MKLLKGEKMWTDYTKNGVTIFICTSKEMDRGLYFLYKVDGEKITKVSKSVNPSDFDKIVFSNNKTVLG